MPSKKLPNRSSLATQRRSLSSIAGSSSSSGPPPSHSDSPSGRPPRKRSRGIPAHWRKLSCVPMAGGKKSRQDLTDGSAGVSFKTKRESVKQWLTLALAPHADLQVKLPLARNCDDLAKVLELTVARIIADKKLVHQIWQLKKCQS